MGFSQEAIEDENRFVLKSRQEIHSVLKDVMKSGAFVTVQFGPARDSLLSAILAVEERAIIVDYGASEALNQKALSSDRLVFIGHHHRVRIEFTLPGMRTVMFRGRPAFQIPFPETLTRLQRRENYRLATRSLRPVKCLFPLGEPRFPQETAEAAVLDISNGGIAILAPPRGLVLSVGSSYPNCRVVLPDAGYIHTSILVRNVSSFPIKSGNQVKRIGCQFMDLDKAATNFIQRFILENER